VERLWRSVKYEDIYIKDYERAAELESGLTVYCRLYDEERSHQSLGYRTPAEVYRAGFRRGGQRYVDFSGTGRQAAYGQRREAAR
jgi:putative transposase